MNTYLVTIEITEELKIYYLLRSITIRNAQAMVERYIRNKKLRESDFRCLRTTVEHIVGRDLSSLERYIKYCK